MRTILPLICVFLVISSPLYSQTNYALSFNNSSSSYIAVPYTDTLQPKAALTVEAWVNVNSWSGTPGLVGNTEFGGYELEIEQVGGVNRINFWVKRNGSYAVAFITQSAFGTGWHHVAGTYDGRNTSIYLDGVLQNTNDAGANYPIQYAYNNALIIGAEAGSGSSPYGYYYNGSLDEVRIWNIARSADSITAAMSRDLIGNEPNLIGYWRFNEGSGTTAIDASPYHQNGTIAAGPVWILFDEGRSWYTIGTAGVSDGIIYYLSLAVSSTGIPYIGYTDYANGNKATVMRYTEYGWLPVGTKPFTTGTAMYMNMTLASDGTPYVAYQDGSNSNKLTVQKFIGAAWTVVGTEGCSAGSVTDVQIRIAPDGTPYVGFADGANSGKPTAMKYNGSSWVVVGNAGFSPFVPSDSDFKLSNDGTPHFALRGGYGSNQRANVVKFNGSNWVSVGNTDFSNNAAYYITLAFSPANVPYVTFSDSKVKVMKDSSSTWVSVGDVNTSTSSYLPVLAFAQDGTPFIGYTDGGFMAVKKFINGAWQFVGTSTVTSSNSDYPSIAVSSTGVPYEAHTENVLGNKPVVKRYLLNSNTPLPVELTSFSASVSASTVTLRWNTATEVNNHGFEVERKKLIHRPNGSLNQSTDESIDQWTEVSFVSGNGTSNVQHEYSYSDRSISAGTYAFRLKQIDRDGKISYSQEIEAVVLSAPHAFELQQNYPNPFNPSTSITFNLRERGHTTLKVYDVIGREAATLTNGVMDAGMHTVQFNAASLASGMYLYKLTSGSDVQIKRMILLK
ncbi:MAG: LamG-like jellyroll fold domain-containing protein [Bacteroidota bacterium]